MSEFVDEAQLHAKAGDGGAGTVSFRREAHVDKGGPDGGDGGSGGDVWVVASVNHSSLLGFRDHPFRGAGDGKHGTSKRMHGSSGRDLEVAVPVGTVITDHSGEVLCDLAQPGDRFLAAAGGQGGRGNARFLSNKRRAPSFAEQGERGQERWLNLELKLAADLALVGFPNAGKSTLISVISAAKPKIANYPFTTLVPNLGVVRRGDTEFVVADIPGLIEGAAEGKGLGHQFLRHVERARGLVVLLDCTAPESPDQQLATLLDELGRYQPDLLTRPRLVVATKIDVATEVPDNVDVAIAAVTGTGIGALVQLMAGLVEGVRREEIAAEHREIVIHRPVPEGVGVEQLDVDRWRLTGRAAERAVGFNDLADDGAMAEALRRLKALGTDRALARAGARDGDEIEVGEVRFTWYRDQGEGVLVDDYEGTPLSRSNRARRRTKS